jgi:uncharacterized membrane protein
VSTESDAEPPQANRSMTERLFRIAVMLKGLDGASQLIGGIVLLLIPPAVITGLVHVIVARDLVPVGMFAHDLQVAAEHLGSARNFAVVYLLLHGVVKLVLVYALLREVRPMYPVAAGVLALFIVYELVRAANTHSIALVVFAALDIVIVVLVLREYVLLRRRRVAESDAGTES